MEPRNCRFRIRRCNGNKSAWLIVLVSADGVEHGGYETSLSVDTFLTNSRHLTPKPGDYVELIP